jgi:hypothetical protein
VGNPALAKEDPKVKRVLMSATVVVLLGALAGSVPALAQPAPSSGLATLAAPKPPSDEFTTTEQYVTQFYPLWFTHNQWRESSTNRLVGPDRILPLYHAVVAINDDTLYASSVMELAAQPVVLTIPATPVTYSILTLDPFGNVLDSGIPKQTPGVFVLTGPGFGGSLPPAVAKSRGKGK